MGIRLFSHQTGVEALKYLGWIINLLVFLNELPLVYQDSMQIQYTVHPEINFPLSLT